jgi:tRNA(Arg) A34 adenosine deaminase TadA
MTDKMCSPSLHFCPPDWLLLAEGEVVMPLVSIEERMNWVLSLGSANIEEKNNGQGGPFAAAVFDVEDHRLIAAGVNLVMPLGCSVLHAEIVALMRAQHQLGVHRLDLIEGRRFELVSSTEPCAMCLGAIPWAGISQLVCGARDEDARAIGFDEGDKPERWSQKLQQRGITVHKDICRAEAVQLLRDYQAGQGKLY